MNYKFHLVLDIWISHLIFLIITLFHYLCTLNDLATVIVPISSLTTRGRMEFIHNNYDIMWNIFDTLDKFQMEL